MHNSLSFNIQIWMLKFRHKITIEVEIIKTTTKPKNTTFRFIKTVKMWTEWHIKSNIRYNIKSWNQPTYFF